MVRQVVSDIHMSTFFLVSGAEQYRSSFFVRTVADWEHLSGADCQRELCQRILISARWTFSGDCMTTIQATQDHVSYPAFNGTLSDQ